jgi:hypothetical protein
MVLPFSGNITGLARVAVARLKRLRWDKSQLETRIVMPKPHSPSGALSLEG